MPFAPSAQFPRLVAARARLHDLQRRAEDPEVSAAFAEAAAAMDRAAHLCGLGDDWWWPAGDHGGRAHPDQRRPSLGAPWAKTGMGDEPV